LFSFFILSAAAHGLGAQAPASIEFSPPEWKYGMIEQGDIARTSLVAANRGERPVELTFVPTCACLTVSPATRVIAPGAEASFALVFDSKDDEGITVRGFIVKNDLPGAKPLYYLLRGVVRVDRPAEKQGGDSAANFGGGPAAGSIKLKYYYTPGCRSCEEFLATEIPKLEASYGVRIALERRDLLSPAVYEELDAFASSIGSAVKAIPALRIGNVLLQGDAEIRDRLPGMIAARGFSGDSAAVPAAAPANAQAASEPDASAAAKLALFPVMAAGLVDGINPCAFTTLIFLLASLALAGRGRREVLAIGALFALGVFLTYFGVGFGLFAALRAASAIALVSAVLRWVLVAVLVIFAALSVYDYTRIKAGRPSEILLQLPNSLKLRIHESIRTRAKTAALAGSSFVLGVLVSIFEFACTGQVYLPTLAYLARAKGRSDALLLLALYNLCFIAPLLVVFGASYLGVSSKRITVIFQRRMGAIKLGLAVVFLALAALTLLS
jgi:cytochrome c biogenesis protein CcdA